MSTREVLVTVMNGKTLVSSGTGVVVCQLAGVSYVLTCAHTLRALSNRTAGPTNPLQILVDGCKARADKDEELASRDLAVLTVSGIVGLVAKLASPPESMPSVECLGFTSFFRDHAILKNHFEKRTVQGKPIRSIAIQLPDATKLNLLEITANSDSPSFERGMSGGPVICEDLVVGVARVLDRTREISESQNSVGDIRSVNKATQQSVGYAIELSDEIRKIIQQKVPCNILGSLAEDSSIGAESGTRLGRPPRVEPKKESILAGDIQKNRWGGLHENFGRRLTVKNLKRHKNWFLFDAVLEVCDHVVTLESPFIFHMHDSFPRSAYWIRKTDGKTAALKEIEANGVFTIGVQFKVSDNSWGSLEYDLRNYQDDDGSLLKYEEMNYPKRSGTQ